MHRKDIELKLLSPHIEHEEQEEDDFSYDPDYNPYKIPADLDLARHHALAKRVGRPNFNKELNICPCCNMHIENEQLKICCNLKELSFLGCAYPFYFFYLKKIILILFTFFFIGGSFNMMVVNWNCLDNCVRFFGFGILNLGNINKQVNGLSWISTTMSILMLIFMVNIKPYFFHAMKMYNDEVVAISYYTIMVQNLPKDLTKTELIDFFERLTKMKIVKVNFAYQIDEYQNYFNRKIQNCSKLKEIKQKLTELHDLEKNREKFQEINNGLIDYDIDENILDLQQTYEFTKRENEDLNRMLSEFENQSEDSVTKKFTGTAFITFNSQMPVKVLVDQWGVTYFKNLFFLFFGNCCNPYLRFKKRTILIHSAPDPTDVIWENLDFSFAKDFLNYTVLYLVSGLILVLSFYIQFLVVKFVFKLRQQTEIEISKTFATNSLIVKMTAIMISSLVTIINAILRIIVYYFAYYQHLYSYTKFNQSYINTYIALVFFNSAFMPYLINTFCYEKATTEQLIWDIHLILLTNAFSTPIYKILDPFAWYRRFKRIYIKFKGKSCILTQHEVNRWFEGQIFDIAENYSYITRTLFLCTWYGSVAPLGVIFGMIGLFFNYWLDKWFLLRVCAFPQNQSEDIIKKIINNLEFLPYLYIFGSIEYNHRVIVSYNLIEFIWAFFFYGVTSFSMTVLLIIYIIFYKKKRVSKNLSELKYDDAKLMMFAEYDRINPLTSNQGNKEWIDFIETSNLSENHKKNLIKKANLNFRETRKKVKSFVANRMSFNRFPNEEKHDMEGVSDEQIIKQTEEMRRLLDEMIANNRKILNEEK